MIERQFQGENCPVLVYSMKAELAASLYRDAWLTAKLAAANVSFGPAHDSSNSPGSSDGRSRRRRVLLWHDETWARRLAFILWPVTGTLVEGFRHAPGWSVRAGVGRIPRLATELDALSRGDLFVWIGPHSLRRRAELPWRSLRERGVRLVLYNTEPERWCPYRTKLVDEVWDFGWVGLQGCMNSCRQRFPTPFEGGRHATFECIGGVKRDTPELTLRLVPPGYLRTTLSTRAVATNRTCAPLTFLGAYRQHLQPIHQRTACFDRLKAALGSDLVQTYDAWEEEPFLRALSSTPFFLSLNKGCEHDGKSPVTFRVARILSTASGGVILSHRCHTLEEVEYAGMVRFLAEDQIAPTYRRLCAGRPQDWQAESRRARDLFRQHFEPQQLFERAGIYRLLHQLAHQN
jgi:hypothetical protein